MLNVVIIVVALGLAGYFAFSKRLAGSNEWQATLTPLASIMGSGFLISAPLLGGLVGSSAVFCMAVLLAVAYAVGEVIRFNIRHFEPIENNGHGAAQSVAFLSRMVLAGAYFISVTYYLQLLAAFLLNAIHVRSQFAENTVTTVLLVVIGGVGTWRGLGMLERLEKYAVALNLGMIAALLVALAVHNSQLAMAGSWHLPDMQVDFNVHSIRVLLGLLIVVQGFETSRYLGEEHPADLRIVTMRNSQLISAAIYVVFIALATVLMSSKLGTDVTAVVNMTQPVALVLPFLISIAAIGSQFSAAVADEEGAGGLIEDLTGSRLPVRYAYQIIMAITIALTWATDVNRIIAYASRAFALYYLLQCVVAVVVAWQQSDLPKRKTYLAGFSTVGVLCLLVFAFGLPAE
ncbi:hypothetical protein [Aeoliella mucimassa]|uniref:Uncharacterized protein n=1 Tax=Aeoliella mucimassa TaxID=2527972 RepID=A0A518ASE9_9BACT|nr:hypothetical protein [Aeoliella mucimassa]QDU57650.1 hypothetical protein Pan181_38690 [Aeoliella mucimassa]